MAVKWYRSLVASTGDPTKEILVGGAFPGEVFKFDYDQPGFHEWPLVENGIIEAVDGDPTKEELLVVARRHQVPGAESMKKEELEQALDSYWEVQ